MSGFQQKYWILDIYFIILYLLCLWPNACVYFSAFLNLKRKQITNPNNHGMTSRGRQDFSVESTVVNQQLKS